MSRRNELAELATDYALEHGLIGLRLRPLATYAGTSDRMLLYHFVDKDDLVAAVLRTALARSVGALAALPASAGPAQAVLDLWAEVSGEEQSRCQRLYVEAAALGVLGVEPHAAVVIEGNRLWLDALASHLRVAGVPASGADPAARLVEAAFMGLQLDQAVEAPDLTAACVRHLAEAVDRLWGAAASG